MSNLGSDNHPPRKTIVLYFIILDIFSNLYDQASPQKTQQYNKCNNSAEDDDARGSVPSVCKQRWLAHTILLRIGIMYYWAKCLIIIIVVVIAGLLMM